MLCILILAVAAAIASNHYVFTPLLNDAVESGAQNTFTKEPKITLMVLAGLAALGAPLTILILLVPSFKATFIATLQKLFNE